MEIIKRFATGRTNLIVLLVLILMTISTITRTALLIKSSDGMDFTPMNLLGIFVIGWCYDLANAAYFIIPLVVYLWFVPSRLFVKSWHRFVLYGIFFSITFMLLLNAMAEWLFWDEFSTRFNFIAVDYLVYTTEVLGNILESYPIGRIIFGITVFASGVLYLFVDRIRATQKNDIPFTRRTKIFVMYFPIPLILFLLVSDKLHRFSSNAYANELAGNGMYQLFAAYRNNELDYSSFYKRMEDNNALSLLHHFIKTPEAEFLTSDTQSINRKIVNPGPEKKLNVVLISVESFSADFMALFGNKNNITPFLDSLSQHSLVFTDLYATGTRTVRGLEALSLCVPPTPGQSIVRRPKNEDLFSLGKVFNEKGYESKYIYGGYGYFDNMNYFFEHNGYKVVDRSSLQNDEIDYENIWGVADENLFELALREINHTVSRKPVFAHVMTTSNHRPYTYPEGRIDIPSHTSRQGAVKYTDYAIGQFIKSAAKTAWYKNTVFVIVADHCASSAGKTELPVNKYHIPMLIFSPAHIQPGSMNRLMSQIDVGPTLLGLLNFSYSSKFFGYDIFKLEPGRERAFISTYQSLGFIKEDKLIILSPQLRVDTFTLDRNREPHRERQEEDLIDEAIAWYQAASYSYQHGLMN